MTTIYVKEQGSRIGRQGERITITKDGQLLETFPLNQIEQIVLMGNVQMTTQAVATLLAQNVDVVYLSSYGKYRGRLSGVGSQNARLRQQQLRSAADTAITLRIAQAIVDGKIHNQRVLLQRQKQRLNALPQRERGAPGTPANQALFDKALAGMLQMQRAALHTTDVDALRGYEGKAAAYYFQALATLLDPAWSFTGRVYYPPTDPFNALLSFGYSLLLKDVLAAVNQVGFDPYVGFFHEIDYGRPSLALDLMEEWRPLIADAMALELVNRRLLLPATFTWTNDPNRPVVLGEAGVAHVFTAYGERLETQVYHPLAGPGGNTATRQAILLQSRRLAHVVMGQETTYEAMKAK